MRLLIITHVFPPSVYSNAKRPYYLAKGFLDAGWEVDVMTSRLGLANGEGEMLTHPRLRIIRKRSRIVSIAHGLRNFRRCRRLFDILCNLTLWPDMHAPWAKSIFRESNNFCKYDRVLAFVLPASVLMAGRFPGLVGKHWTFDFQESVTPQNKKHPRRAPVLRLLANKLAQCEKEVLHKAGRVVFTANSNRIAYTDMGLVDRTITEHIPYFYDEKSFLSPVSIDDGFHIGYYGNFDLSGYRTPGTFLRSLALFLSTYPQARNKTRFLFRGDWLPAHNRYLEQLDLKDVVEIAPAVPYHEYIHMIRRSPVLLLVVAEEHGLFMPSKIVDYFGAQRPILAFVPNDGEIHDVLLEAGMGDFLCGESDISAGAKALEKLWDSYMKGSLQVDSSRTAKWSSSTQIAHYVKMLEPPLPDE